VGVATPLSIALGGLLGLVNALRSLGLAGLAMWRGGQQRTGEEEWKQKPNKKLPQQKRKNQKAKEEARKDKKQQPKQQKKKKAASRSSQRSLGSVISDLLSFGAVVVMVAALSSLFLATLVPFARSTHPPTFSGLPALARTAYSYAEPWFATSSYGLFARWAPLVHPIHDPHPLMIVWLLACA